MFSCDAKSNFVDTETVGAANINKISSEVGRVLRRTPTEYVGKSENIPLKGFGKPVDFHTVFWGRDPYGVKPSQSSSGPLGRIKNLLGVGQAADRVDARPKTVSVGSYLGRFTEWRGNSGRVRGNDGTEYFCHKGSVLEGFTLQGGEEVFFVVSATEKQLDMANAIVPLGVEISGSIVNIDGNNGFLKSPTLEQFGHENIYAWLGDEEVEVFDVGGQVEFTLGKGFNKQKERYTMRAEGLRKT